MEVNELTEKVIGCAIEVHRELGAGLLESTYEKCLGYELQKNEIEYVAQAILPIEYKGMLIESGYRIDILVPDILVVELKSVEALDKIHEVQLLTYMKLSKIRTGLLINFNVRLLKYGVRRFVL